MISAKKLIYKICEKVGAIKGNVGTLQTDVETLKTDYVVETGTSSNYEYVKWASGRLDIWRAWNVGTYTFTQTYSGASISYGGDITVNVPPMMTSGSFEVTLLGNSSNSACFLEKITLTSFRIAKVGSAGVTVNNLTVVLRSINGRWK